MDSTGHSTTGHSKPLKRRLINASPLLYLRPKRFSGIGTNSKVTARGVVICSACLVGVAKKLAYFRCFVFAAYVPRV